MSLPLVVFWLILAGPSVHSTIPYDSKAKCEEAGKDLTAKFDAKGFHSEYVCQEDIIDIPAVDMFFRP